MGRPVLSDRPARSPGPEFLPAGSAVPAGLPRTVGTAEQPARRWCSVYVVLE